MIKFNQSLVDLYLPLKSFWKLLWDRYAMSKGMNDPLLAMQYLRINKILNTEENQLVIKTDTLWFEAASFSTLEKDTDFPILEHLKSMS